jgi:facilitated trehalose transporter
MLGELLPERCRGLASGMLSAVVYIYIFVIVKCYPGMLALFGQAVVFWVFGLVSALGTIFVYFFLPETRGKTLDEIEQSFKSK